MSLKQTYTKETRVPESGRRWFRFEDSFQGRTLPCMIDLGGVSQLEAVVKII